MKPTLQEQIAAFEARRAASVARMNEIVEAAGEEGATLDTAQQEEFDTLQQDIESIDGHLRRLKLVEAQQVRSATPVNGDTVTRAIGSRSGSPIITVRANVKKGTAFTRYAIALMRSRGDLMLAAEIAKHWHDTTPEVETVLRAAVAAGTTTDPAWAAPLVEYQTMADEFIELLRPQTIVGRITGFRRVPFNIKMPAQQSGSTVGWVGEGKPKPVSALAFETVTLGFAKIAGIVVMTEELIRFSNPSAEDIVSRDLTETVAELIDRDFVDPAKAAVPGTSPASITNGAVSIPASGVTADALRADIRALFAAFIAANLSIAGAVWITDPVTALSIGMMQNPLGQAEFPGVDQNGGLLLGLPVIPSANVPNDPTTGGMLILCLPREILLADDGGVTLDASREASLQMNSAPTEGAAQLVSLWQNNMAALRAERAINWARRRPESVVYITGAHYGAAEAAGGDNGGAG
ncbi:HK97 family phage major capsid protein [Paraburkholderia atlantica]|uniref:phage major capsid protein n=1 Tax=Paraburkholderia atlantica TaxID=2654982 RepID=UPI003D2378CE